MSAPPGKKRKVNHALEKPYESAEIPKLALEDQQIILELLCSLLQPIGTYASQHVKASQGKRQKRRHKSALKQANAVKSGTNAPAPPAPSPPIPEISDHLLIGFNVLNRHLEGLAAFTASTGGKAEPADSSLEGAHPPAPVAAIFYPAQNVSNLLTHRLPILCHCASLNQPDAPPIRLIPLSLPHAFEALSKALHLPRANFLGVLGDGDTSTDSLIKFCREKVGPPRLPWLDGLQRGQYEAVNVKRIETFEGIPKKQKAKKKISTKGETTGKQERPKMIKS